MDGSRRVWISSDHVQAVAEKGFKLIHAASDFFYLDCGGGGWVGQNVLGNSWCDPFKTWQKVPIPSTCLEADSSCEFSSPIPSILWQI